MDIATRERKLRPINNLAMMKTPGVVRYAPGLYLQVRAGKHEFRRSWVFRYRLNGQSRWFGLGEADLVSIADAKEAAIAARKVVKAGQDPIDMRRVEKAEQRAKATLNTFRDVALAYIAAHQDGWKNAKHKAQWHSTLETHAFPVLGGLPVASVDTGAVMRVLEPIWRATPETASRLRGRIESVLDYATARGWRTGENPARWKGHLDNLMPARSKLAPVEHHAALPWREIGGFMAKLAEQDGVAPMALRFAILTATRTSETLNATWGEIDLSGPDAPVWTIPAARMKAGKEHRVPLSDGAVAILRTAKMLRTTEKPDEPVFPGQKPGKGLSNMAMLMLLRRMGREDLTTHGFRSTFRDWIAESTAYPRELAESALAHTVGGVEGAYQRGPMLERRRKLMADWAGFCARPMATGEIVAFRPAAG